MDVLALAIGILLAGQVGDAASDRYATGADVAQESSTGSAMDAAAAFDASPLQPVPPSRAETPPPKPTTVRASELWRAINRRADDAQLAGDELTLQETLADTTDRQEQTQRVIAYWDLAAAVAKYRLALREQQEVTQICEAMSDVSARGQLAKANASVRVSESQRAVIDSQYHLRRLLRLNQAERLLPLPVSEPHCGSYDTKFTELSNDPQLCDAARRLHQVLPMHRDELVARARAVVYGEEVRNQVPLTAPLETALEVHNELIAARRRFVDAVHGYNREIALYTQCARPQPLATDRLVSMLIKTEPRSTPMRDDGVVPAVRVEEAPESTFRPPQQNTTGPDSNTPPNGVERSVLQRNQ